MRQKRAITESILHKIPDKTGVKHKEAHIEPVRGTKELGSKYSKDGAKLLTEEKRRMEQNRILRRRLCWPYCRALSRPWEP